METAILWRLTPFSFMERPPMERAIMTAHHRERSLRAAMISKVQHDLASKKTKDPPTTDHTSDFFGGLV